MEAIKFKTNKQIKYPTLLQTLLTLVQLEILPTLNFLLDSFSGNQTFSKLI